jgi:hypothetical protein
MDLFRRTFGTVQQMQNPTNHPRWRLDVLNFIFCLPNRFRLSCRISIQLDGGCVLLIASLSSCPNAPERKYYPPRQREQ